MKDWKGNSNSAHAAIGAKKPGSTNKREQDDFYATDPKAIEALFNAPCFSHTQVTELLKLVKNDKWYCIWECAAGNGNLSNWLRENGYYVYATDIKDRGGNNVVPYIDFLKTKRLPIVTTDSYYSVSGKIKPRIKPFFIITNPPYSLATEFIEHALEILPHGGLYIALMNITYLHGIDRYKRLYSKGTLREVYVFSKKIHVYKNNIPTGHTSMCVYAWYVFQKGYNGQPTLYWL